MVGLMGALRFLIVSWIGLIKHSMCTLGAVAEHDAGIGKFPVGSWNCFFRSIWNFALMPAVRSSIRQA